MARGIVRELQKECLDESASITSILRKARLIATKLDLDDLTDWIRQETDGYRCSPNDLPTHRKGAGQPKFLNPYNGWCPIQTSDDWFGEQLHTVYLFQPVSELEHMLGTGSDTLVMSFMGPLEETVQSQLPTRMQAGIHFSKAQIVRALDFVRNKTLDWTIELEAQGILGEDLSFEKKDKEVAQTVTNNIYGGNVGVLGHVAGDASARGFVAISETVSIAKVKSFAHEVLQATPGLPQDIRSDVERLAQELSDEAETAKPSRERLGERFASLKAILEGASGNLVAQGILSGLASLAG